MYLLMDDTSSILGFETKPKYSNQKFVEITESYLEDLNDNFILIVKKVLEQNNYINIKLCTERPEFVTEISFKDVCSLSFNDKEIDIQGKDTLSLIESFREDIECMFPVCEDEGYMQFKISQQYMKRVSNV